MGWCTDRGALVTWNLGRESVNASRPDVNIEVDNCLMSCAYHPEHPVSGRVYTGAHPRGNTHAHAPQHMPSGQKMAWVACALVAYADMPWLHMPTTSH